MLNHGQGTVVAVDGGDAILSSGDGTSHAVFGPYVHLDAGRYVVDFPLALGAGSPGGAADGDRLCAILDVAIDDGRTVVAHGFVFAGQLSGEVRRISLGFVLTEDAERVEYRVRLSGACPVIAADDPVARRIDDAAALPGDLAPRSPLERDHPREIVDLFMRGYAGRRDGDGLRFETRGLAFHAAERDDVNFVAEVLEQQAYNLVSHADQCVIDIGMNVGLTSLAFARRPQVKEVHAFEPFPTTYAKAMRNLGLNPAIAGKVTAHNLGLSDHHGDEVVLVPDTDDSGSRSTISVATGRPTSLRLRDAATQLAPVIERARARRRLVVAKIDCEGSEFAIFESLGKAGLLTSIDAFLVEWHAMFAGKTVSTLTEPLLAAGYTVIDLSPPRGNGFFYAFRTARRQRSAAHRKVRRLLGRWTRPLRAARR